ncbi:hypothetical protein [Candidatus Berkiella aquae]|uniref:Transglutaminase-like superfamily protein n=1 Tax=Candidatus Berkiella aquae TaxID=295108 RepID=A0A0Q9YF61_9GAMM|nr:hypothetical protein [Candidatus Berkiella aquae]MCS5712916.1 hypothetical protein [Candidatus Berkiella aquae]
MYDLKLGDTEIGQKIKRYGVTTYQGALDFVNQLPYGRNQSSTITCVLEEKRGTCSTKHAFLAALAQDNELPVKLMFGYYHMNKQNTPAIGNTLDDHGLPFILEGHCYLKYREQILDVTFPESIKTELGFDIFDEQEISPFELYQKPLNHKGKLKTWLKNNPSYPVQDLDQLWKIREACIKAAADHYLK